MPGHLVGQHDAAAAAPQVLEDHAHAGHRGGRGIRAVGRGAAIASLAHHLVEPFQLVRAIHGEDRQLRPEIAPGDVVAAQVRDHEDDGPVALAQLLDVFPADASHDLRGDLVDGPEQCPHELGRPLADLGGVFPRHATGIPGSRGEPRQAQVFADAPAVARGEPVNEAAQECSHRMIRPQRQVGERSKEEFQLKDGG